MGRAVRVLRHRSVERVRSGALADRHRVPAGRLTPAARGATVDSATETCLSGRKEPPAKRLGGVELPPGFESRRLRQAGLALHIEAPRIGKTSRPSAYRRNTSSASDAGSPTASANTCLGSIAASMNPSWVWRVAGSSRKAWYFTTQHAGDARLDVRHQHCVVDGLKCAVLEEGRKKPGSDHPVVDRHVAALGETAGCWRRPRSRRRSVRAMPAATGRRSRGPRTRRTAHPRRARTVRIAARGAAKWSTFPIPAVR